MTELPDVDTAAVERFWSDVIAAGSMPADASSADADCFGDLFIATDGTGQPRAVIRTTDWLDAHTSCFMRAYERLGLEFHPDIAVVFERFELVHPA